MIRPVHFLTQTVGAVALFSLSSCSSLGSAALPAGLLDALGGVTNLSGAVGQFTQSLGPTLNAAGLGQLRGFVDQAGSIGSTISGFQDQVSEAAADPLGMITNKLGDMANFDVNRLANLPGAEQMKSVKGFADSATGVGSAASDFLSKFGG